MNEVLKCCAIVLLTCMSVVITAGIVLIVVEKLRKK